jgi:hypothetical protein
LTAGEAFDDYVFYDLGGLPLPGQEVKTDAFARSAAGGAVITAVAASRLGLRCSVVSGLSLDAARLLADEQVSVRNLVDLRVRLCATERDAVRGCSRDRRRGRVRRVLAARPFRPCGAISALMISFTRGSIADDDIARLCTTHADRTSRRQNCHSRRAFACSRVQSQAAPVLMT